MNRVVPLAFVDCSVVTVSCPVILVLGWSWKMAGEHCAVCVAYCSKQEMFIQKLAVVYFTGTAAGIE